MAFDDLKAFNGKAYSGMQVGKSHHWKYPDGTWDETKVAPDKWHFRFSSIKRRREDAPEGSGVPVNTEYHWYITADQVVRKVSANEYQTMMEGLKTKIGHKRPYWKRFSYDYSGQQGYKQRLLDLLKESVKRLESGRS